MRKVAALLAVAMVLSGASVADAVPPPWYPPLLWDPASPDNYETGRAGVAVQYIVIHATDGRAAGALAWFRDPASQLSAHYVIRASDGAITQTVAEADTAFHARGFNRRSIGIEHEFDPASGVGYTDPEYRASAALVCAIARRYGIPADRAHIIGHSEVPGTDHTDPGPTWDWTFFMGLVAACGTGAPAAGLAAGDDGASVAQLQRALVRLGHLAATDLAGGEGHFGPRTLAALRSFQDASGVPATGYYGERSAAALAGALAGASGAVPAIDLVPGDESPAVADLQRALGRRGYMDLVTGYFGPITRDAVRRFQGDHRIAPTGSYGPLTRAALARDLP